MQKNFLFLCLFLLWNPYEGKMKVIAHKGASMEAPENTLIAFQKAIHLGADFIECDIRLTKDKIPVVIHHETIHIGTKNISIHHLTLDEVHEWDAGEWFLKKFSGEKVPTLKELLGLDFGKTGLMIEVKEMDCLEDLQYIYAVIQKYNTNERYYVGSRRPHVVKYLQDLDGSLPLIGIAQSERDLEEFLSLHLSVMALRHQLITPKRIQELHNQNIEVWTWTVDDPTYHVAGLDGVITNNLARFLQTKTHGSSSH